MTMYSENKLVREHPIIEPLQQTPELCIATALCRRGGQSAFEQPMFLAEGYNLPEVQPKWPLRCHDLSSQAFHVCSLQIHVGGQIETGNGAVEPGVLNDAGDDAGPFHETGVAAARSRFSRLNPLADHGVKAPEDVWCFLQDSLHVQGIVDPARLRSGLLLEEIHHKGPATHIRT